MPITPDDKFRLPLRRPAGRPVVGIPPSPPPPSVPVEMVKKVRLIPPAICEAIASLPAPPSSLFLPEQESAMARQEQARVTPHGVYVASRDRFECTVDGVHIYTERHALDAVFFALPLQDHGWSRDTARAVQLKNGSWEISRQ